MKKLLLILMLVSVVFSQTNHTGWPLELLSWNVDKAYPGIEYNYRLGIKGGEYPYRFYLRHGPTGMTCDTITGEIKWVPSGATVDSVRVSVRDMLGDSLVVEYVITATTTGFYFVDSANGNNANAGTEAEPWLTMAYAAATADSSSYVYVKKGTYSETFTMVVNKCGRFFAYPGDSVAVIGAGTTTASFGVVGKNRIFQGFVFDGNDLRWLFCATGDADRLIWRKNEMRNLYDTDAQNPSFIFFAAQSGEYDGVVIQDNIFYDVRDPVNFHGASVTCFDVKNLLYENNKAYDMDGNGINDKGSGRENTIRGNDISGCKIGVGLLSQGSQIGIEICYNKIYGTSRYGTQIGLQPGYISNVFIHHNTYKGRISIMDAIISNVNSGNINIYKNIIGNGTVNAYDMGAWPTGFSTKMSIDSNIVFGLVDSSKVVGHGGSLANFKQWRDSSFDINSLYMQLTYDADSIPILSDSLLAIYGHLASGNFIESEPPIIPTFIQSHDTTNDKYVSTLSLKYDSPNTAGNCLIAVVEGYWVGSGHSVSDSLNNTWELVDSVWYSTATCKVSVWVAKNCKAGATKVTATYSPNQQRYVRMAILEYSGIDTTTPIAAHKTFYGSMPSAGTDALASGDLTPSYDGSLLFATFQEANNASNTNASQGTGFNLRVKTSDSYHLLVEDKINSGTSPVQSTFTLGTTQTGSYVGIYAIFNPLGTYVPDPEPPVITVQPRDTTVNDGQSAPFTIAATNATGYQWYGNGSLISGATNSVYSFTATLAHNNSKIYCIVYNATDTISSDTVTLTVNALPKTPANITVEPVSDTVTAGQEATFFVTASGSGLVYQWYRNDSLIAGATNDTFTYTARSQVGNYTDNIYCLLTTDTTISTDTVNLLVNGIVFRQSTDTIKLKCSATNALTYQWYDNNVAVTGATDSVYTIYADSTFYSIKHVIYCLVNGSVKSGEWKFQTPGIINRKITIGPNLKIY